MITLRFVSEPGCTWSSWSDSKMGQSVLCADVADDGDEITIGYGVKYCEPNPFGMRIY